MLGLVEQIPFNAAIRHVFVDAPVRPVTLNNGMQMPAWYDIQGMRLTDREDKIGISESDILIQKVIRQQMKEGFALNQIILAGFSQGGAMALYTGLQLPGLGGIIALSAYLPLADTLKPTADKDIPIFMARGELDGVVLPVWTELSVQYLLGHGLKNVTNKAYRMEHTVSMEEVGDLIQWYGVNISADGKNKEAK